MVQLTLQFENVSIKNQLLKLIESMNGVSVVETKPVSKKKSGLDEALEDLKAGRVSEYASVDDFFNQMGL